MLIRETPAAVGLHPQRWQSALQLIDQFCTRGELPAAAVLVARNGKTTGTQRFGKQSPASDAPPLRDDSIFLVASITKPIVAMGATLLVERGQLLLDDRVEHYIPEFGRQGKHAVTIRHLLTHTSGLPDMLENNRELRTAHAPLSEFVAETCRLSLTFPPGTGVQYQSMGLLLLGEIMQRITGRSCPQFLHEEFFKPLGMRETALGAPDEWFTGPHPQADRIATLRLPADMEGDTAGWNWNSRYWRQLGAPWGGLLTTPDDLACFAQLMLQEGLWNSTRLLAPGTVRAATSNHLHYLRNIPAEESRQRPWGLGWRLNWPGQSANFGDFLGQRSYGHWGATGTLLWIDPDTQSFCIVLTTQPQEPQGKYLARISNAILGAFL